jgi:hypothetical protein
MIQTLTATIARSIGTADPAAWDAVSPAMSFYSTAGWLACAEAVTGGLIGGVMVHDGDRLVAAVPFWVTTGRENPSRTPRRVLASVGVTGTSFLVAGTSTAYLGEFLIGDRVSREAVARAVVAALRGLADELGVDGCLALYASTATSRLYRTAADRVPVLLDTDAWIPVPQSFEDYPLHVSAHRRMNVHREWRTFLNAGYSLGVEHLEDCVQELVPLSANLERKYGNPVDEGALHGVLSIQGRLCRAQDRVFTARRGGVLRAAALTYLHRDVLIVRLFAADYGRLCDAYEHYGLTYYLPVRYAADQGCRWVGIGIASASTKASRGAQLSPLWAVDLSTRPLWTAEAAQAENSARAAAYAGSLGRNATGILADCELW